MSAVAYQLAIIEEPVYQDAQDASGQWWRRTGTCTKCGECCNSGDPFSGEMGEPVVPGACPFFRWDVEPAGGQPGVGRCSDRTNAYYLAGCVNWPYTPDSIVDYPRCTYTFAEIDPPSP